MDALTRIKEVIEEGNYRDCRNFPDLSGKLMCHVDTVRVLDLTEKQAEAFKARFDAGIDINTEVVR